MERIIRQINSLSEKINREIHIMEVCGTHTVSIFKYGIRSLLAPNIKLLSGPGCPVCVTSVADLDKAIEVSQAEDTILTTFGDMMRVPGSKKSLYDIRSLGADIRIVYSPTDALEIAKQNKTKKVVFFATGFETTSPSIAATMYTADSEGVKNFYIHSVHKLVPPALQALLSFKEIKIDGFLLPGHVSTIIGVDPYRFISDQHNIASVITGFGAEDILQGILMILNQMASGNFEVEVQYKGAVRRDGNPRALEMLKKYFKTTDAEWRGIGILKESGLALKEDHEDRNIFTIMDVEISEVSEPKACRCGDVLTGKILPTECSLFGKTCTPERPVGACMVSTEGSCAAYYKYGAF